jgi:hypothetical protein
MARAIEIGWESRHPHTRPVFLFKGHRRKIPPNPALHPLCTSLTLSWMQFSTNASAYQPTIPYVRP